MRRGRNWSWGGGGSGTSPWWVAPEPGASEASRVSLAKGGKTHLSTGRQVANLTPPGVHHLPVSPLWSLFRLYKFSPLPCDSFLSTHGFPFLESHLRLTCGPALPALTLSPACGTPIHPCPHPLHLCLGPEKPSAQGANSDLPPPHPPYTQPLAPGHCWHSDPSRHRLAT